MHFFRRVPASNELEFRLMRDDDVAAVGALIEQTTWSALALPIDEVPLVLPDRMSLVAEYHGKLWACMLVSWSQQPAAWIRGLVVHHSLRPNDVLPRMLHELRQTCIAQGVRDWYSMLDSRDVHWIQPALLHAGFKHLFDVVGYEKHSMHVPAWGNTSVTVRPATAADVAAAAAVDAQAFTAEWIKNEAILHGVYPIAPLYLVAELKGAVIGYAFATSHHNGRMLHLVRIAVLPAYQQQGVGVRLLAEVVVWCQDQQVRVLSLNTQGTNLRAQRLYQWFGFVRNSERQAVLHVQLIS